MRTYLCSRCHKKIPRSELLDHRRDCGGDLDEHKGFFGRLKTGTGILATLALALALAAVSLFLGRSSFRSLADMRQLERVPATSVRAILPGEVNLDGAAAKADSLLDAPQTNTPSVFYRYKVERREKDSDGDTRWVTETDQTRFVPFRLRDDTGAVRVIPDKGVDFSVRESWSTRRGDRRYTEYRIEPGDSLFVFGFARRDGNEFSVVFQPEGHYRPIISEYGETRERSNMAGGSILKVWFGLIALALALSFLIFALRQHRLLLYFSILNLAVVVYLVSLGLHMMKLDLQSAMERLEAHKETAREEIQTALSSHALSWDGDWETLPAFSRLASQGLPANERARLGEIRVNLARGVQRTRRQRDAFPEKVLAPLWGIPRPEPLPLPDARREALDAEVDAFEQARVPATLGWVGIGLGLLVGLAAFVAGFRKIRFKRCMENLPTTPTTGAAYGLTEFKGVVDLAESADWLKSPLAHRPCAHYHYKVEEKRGSGKKSKWVTVVDETRRIPFLCRDADGALLVDPAGAKVYSSQTTSKRRGRRRYRETRLEQGDPLYAIGECAIDPARGDRLYLRDPEGDYPFILGNLTESRIMLRIARVGVTLLNASFAGLLLAALLLFGLSGSFAATDYLAAALAAPLFMTCVTLALHYNDLVFLRERARRNWSNIDVSLKKRADLVPRLESIAKALMDHERDLHESITEMRKLYNAEVARTPEGVKQYLEAEHASLKTLMIRSEDYPDLKSDRQTALLMRALIVLENEISLMRNGYNDAVETYNTRIQSFPDVFFANLFHFREEPLVFAETEVVRVPPSIQDLWEQEQTPAPSPLPPPPPPRRPEKPTSPRPPRRPPTTTPPPQPPRWPPPPRTTPKSKRPPPTGTPPGTRLSPCWPRRRRIPSPISTASRPTTPPCANSPHRPTAPSAPPPCAPWRPTTSSPCSNSPCNNPWPAISIPPSAWRPSGQYGIPTFPPCSTRSRTCFPCWPCWRKPPKPGGPRSTPAWPTSTTSRPPISPSAKSTPTTSPRSTISSKRSPTPPPCTAPM